MSEEKKSHYISARESRRIAKENVKITRAFEKEKKRKKSEEEYLTEIFVPTFIHNRTVRYNNRALKLHAAHNL